MLLLILLPWTQWAPGFRPWVPYLLLPPVVWLTWKVAVAWEGTRVASVEVGPLQLDTGPNKVFYVVVTNGHVPATISVLINGATDSAWPLHLEHHYEAHWRGRPPEFAGTFFEGSKSQAGLLGVARRESGNPSLFIWAKAEPFPFISRDVPLEQQGVITLEVVVTYETRSGGRGTAVKRFFRVAPDPGSDAGYRVVTDEKSVPLAKPLWLRVRRVIYLAYVRLVRGQRVRR